MHLMLVPAIILLVTGTVARVSITRIKVSAAPSGCNIDTVAPRVLCEEA